MYTPSTATKASNFSTTQKNYIKSNINLYSRDIKEIVFGASNFDAPIELKEMFLYSLVSDALISDGDTIEDSEANEYTVFIFNGGTIAIDEYFKARITGDNIYLLKQ